MLFVLTSQPGAAPAPPAKRPAGGTQAPAASGKAAAKKDDAAKKPGEKAEAKKPDPDSLFKSETFSGLALRNIGPAVASGRITDIAVDPTDRSTWYLAVASGGVWKTVNAGTTWTPIFDKEASYSIGCITIDPHDRLTLWVGSGENDSQRSVSYGDGVYKSTDGGKSWTNVGLKDSEHIGQIAVNPKNSDVVYVAAQGPLWRAGGDRGLYKTSDGGKTWEKILNVDEYTGINEVVLDPRDPDVIYATSYQRHRQVWTLIDGGPGSGVWKSRDGGKTWKKLTNGLPREDKGRIGLAISPVNPNVVYAVVEAADKGSGFYRSTDGGGNWDKMSDYVSTSPQYYNEIVADPQSEGRVYALDTWMMVTDDAGRNFRRVGERFKHVDNHALWIDPADTKHLIAGCDGGLYQTFDRGATWQFAANLPITQFYNVAVDYDLPFYNVYGGTQDNNTLGGPSRTGNAQGIRNSDWVVVVGGDGFQCAADPADANTVYGESQHAGVVRFDRKTGERVDIQPQSDPGQPGLRWNWDTPLLISPHSHTRLYMAAQRLFRSDDRGDTWKAVGPDLTRQIDRNKLKVMGRVWSVDAVAKNASTSFYGNSVSLDESPKQEGLLYIGTDDGLIQVSEDGGATWRKEDHFTGVPEMTYVSDVVASQHQPGTVFAAFDHHKTGDFKPYLLRSDDRGRTWTSIAGNLPERGTVYAFAEDHVDPNLLFAGTEFGVWFTVDGGKRWTQLKGGMPTIAIRDIVIQRRENDLVLASFGRGFYILDDYSPLRKLKTADLERATTLFAVPPASIYVQATPLGLREKGSQGDAFYTASNPPIGATFTYYMRDEIKTLKKQRQEKERETAKKGGDVFYPTWDALHAEDREEEPSVVLTVSDDAGNVVRRINGPVGGGFHRVAWDLRYPASNPVSLRPQGEENPFADRITGPLVAPGDYKVQLETRVHGVLSPVGAPVTFHCAPLGESTVPVADRAATLAFEQKTARLQRAVLGAVEAGREGQTRLNHIKKALDETPAVAPALMDSARAIERRL
ncbi:MAG: glycosyl hydrolase, partial [Candidatus Eisenbacteria bacterium]|nr:glycosyl hydrolase [Candidatus Eisenbacteria bacterium]